jgi:hypothetical protein
MPLYMLSDGGPPFGSSGLGRLSRLGVWLVRNGVIPVLIEPGRPDQNGRHERFHETLKAETASPPRASIRAQQESFDRFQSSYNEERPHEGLGMRVPAEVYDLSPRKLVEHLPAHQYESSIEPRSVRGDGSIRWAGATVFVGEAFTGEVIGLERIEDGLWLVQLGALRVGILHERSKTIAPLAGGVTHVPGHGRS